MITILCSNMASNALGRALVLAQAAQGAGEEVRVVGSLRKGGKIWAPARHLESQFGFETFELYGSEDYFSAVRKFLKIFNKDKGPLIVSKPLPTSFGLVLMAGLAWRKDVILDIDDWELGFRLKGDMSAFDGGLNKVKIVLSSLPMDRMNTDLGVYLCDHIARLFPRKIVSNGWLKSRFGGEYLPHVRDAEVLKPGGDEQGQQVRAELKMEASRLWFGFIGTPRLHKGLDVLVGALSRLEHQNVGLVLLGCKESDPVGAEVLSYAREALGEERVRHKGSFAFEELAEHVAAVDVVVIPSRLNSESVGQIPAKLFDAMAMAKPVVVTRVNDMADILAEGAGVVVEPDDEASLAEGLGQVARMTSEQREAMGARARERFEQRYSLSQGVDVMRAVLDRWG